MASSVERALRPKLVFLDSLKTITWQFCIKDIHVPVLRQCTVGLLILFSSLFH